MRKYILLALMPFILQSSIFCKNQFEDIDAIIINELRAAQKAMHSNTSLTLKTILQALVSFGRKTGNRASAIECIVRIQKALLVCKSEQYNPAWYDICGFFSSKPKIVTKQIEPALKEVDKAFKDLKITSSEYSFAFKAVIATFVGGLIVYFSAAAVRKYVLYQSMDTVDFSTKEGVAEKWAELIAQFYFVQDHPDYIDFKNDVWGEIRYHLDHNRCSLVMLDPNSALYDPAKAREYKDKLMSDSRYEYNRVIGYRKKHKCSMYKTERIVNSMSA